MRSNSVSLQIEKKEKGLSFHENDILYCVGASESGKVSLESRKGKTISISGTVRALRGPSALRVATGLAPPMRQNLKSSLSEDTAKRIAQHFRRVTLRKHLRYWRKFAHPRRSCPGASVVPLTPEELWKLGKGSQEAEADQAEGCQ